MEAGSSQRPPIVCLCGSTRFWKTFQQIGLRETLAGRIVLSIGADGHSDDDDHSFGGYIPHGNFDQTKKELDELHLRKIEMADEVLILNVGGYIGESTRRELAHARGLGKPVRWLEPDKADITTRAAMGLGQAGSLLWRSLSSLWPSLPPVRQYQDDCGYDIHVSQSVAIPPGEFCDIPCNIAVQLPPQTWGLLMGRSSAFRKRGVLVLPGIIDGGYRGELFTAAYNTDRKVVMIEEGERISQLIVMPLLAPPVMEAAALTETDRGGDGFGSTGS